MINSENVTLKNTKISGDSYYQSLRERVFPLLPYTSFFEQVAAIDEQHIE
jgi:hypothetical protein